MHFRWFSSRFRSSAAHGSMSRSSRRFRIESLEPRQLLAVMSSFDPVDGSLAVTATAAGDNVAITSAGGNVLINGENPGGGPDTVLAADVISIDVAASGDFANDIDLSGVTTGEFAGLLTGNVTIDGGLGDDTIDGSAVGDLIIGGGGTDDLSGNEGDDIFDISGSSATVTPGAGFDTIRHTVANPAGETVTLSPAAIERLEITGGTGADTITVSGGAEAVVIIGGGDGDTIDVSGLTSAAAQVTLDGGSGNDIDHRWRRWRTNHRRPRR